MLDNLITSPKKVDFYKNYYFFDGKNVKNGRVISVFDCTQSREFYLGAGHKAKILNSDYLVGIENENTNYPKMYNVNSHDGYYAVKESDLYEEFNDCVMAKIVKTEEFLAYLRDVLIK